MTAEFIEVSMVRPVSWTGNLARIFIEKNLRLSPFAASESGGSPALKAEMGQSRFLRKWKLQGFLQ
jgi:hypothetical protein